MFKRIGTPDHLEQYLDKVFMLLLKEKTRFYNENITDFDTDENKSERFHFAELKSMFDRRKKWIVERLNTTIGRQFRELGQDLYQISNVKIDLEYNRMTSPLNNNLITTGPKGFIITDTLREMINLTRLNISDRYFTLKLDNMITSNMGQRRVKKNFIPDLLIHARGRVRSDDISNDYLSPNMVVYEGKVCNFGTSPSEIDEIRANLSDDLLKLLFMSMIYEIQEGDNIVTYGFNYHYQIFIRICTFGKRECMKQYSLDLQNFASFFNIPDSLNITIQDNMGLIELFNDLISIREDIISTRCNKSRKIDN